jgi:hypothetical protein
MQDSWTPRIKDGPSSPTENENYDISKEDLDHECENLFSDTPIRFIPREKS